MSRDFYTASRLIAPRPPKTDWTTFGAQVALTAIWLYLTAHLVWAALEVMQ